MKTRPIVKKEKFMNRTLFKI